MGVRQFKGSFLVILVLTIVGRGLALGRCAALSCCRVDVKVLLQELGEGVASGPWGAEISNTIIIITLTVLIVPFI